MKNLLILKVQLTENIIKSKYKDQDQKVIVGLIIDHLINNNLELDLHGAISWARIKELE